MQPNATWLVKLSFSFECLIVRPLVCISPSQGTLQKFVDDLFTVILSTSRPVPLAVKYFFDLLDDQALQHNITDPETVHIWKTNRYHRLCLRHRGTMHLDCFLSTDFKQAVWDLWQLSFFPISNKSLSSSLRSLPLRFWINILKNPHFIFDVHTSDNVDAVLSVIAQTFMDSCTIADHKLGRVSRQKEHHCFVDLSCGRHIPGH